MNSLALQPRPVARAEVRRLQQAASAPARRSTARPAAVLSAGVHQLTPGF